MRPYSVSALAVSVFTLALLTSCSNLPTQPQVSPGPAPGAGSSGLSQIDDPPAPGQGPTGEAASVTLALGEEGTLQVGHFKLVLKRHSLTMPATIRMRQPDPNVMQVEFEITPAAANNFQDSVKLIADCSNTSMSDVREETLYWWDGDWMDSGRVSKDDKKHTLSTEVHRLATCKVDAKGLGAGKFSGR